MNTTPRRRIVVAIVLTLAVIPSLSGCFGVNPIQGIVKGATGGNVDVGGTTVPSDFPKDIPLVKGEVLSGGAFGSGKDKIWNVAIKVKDAGAFDSITTDLEDAGFTAEGNVAGQSDKGKTGIFSGDEFGVLVVVAENKGDGFVANYTVTTVNK